MSSSDAGDAWDVERYPSEFHCEDAAAFAAIAVLGPEGRMLAASKHAYRDAHPNRDPVFNANVCVRSAGKIWYGDLDLALDDERLVRLANRLGETVYVLHEHDARFHMAEAPRYDRAAGTFSPRATSG